MVSSLLIQSKTFDRPRFGSISYGYVVLVESLSVHPAVSMCINSEDVKMACKCPILIIMRYQPSTEHYEFIFVSFPSSALCSLNAKLLRWP